MKIAKKGGFRIILLSIFLFIVILPLVLALDSDGDGIEDSLDNCPNLPNPDQAEIDDDGVGDACDTCPLDFDPLQFDLDEDGRGDACDTLACPSQMVAYWNLDEGVGFEAYDSLNGFTGTLEIGTALEPQWTIGKINSGLEFEGDGEHVLVSDLSNYNPDEELTLEAFVMPEDITTIRRDIISGGTFKLFIEPDTPTTFVFGFEIDTDTGNFVIGSAPQSILDWYHVVGTYNGAELKIFINSVEENLVFANGNIAQGSDFVIGTTSPIEIVSFKGKIDEVAIYKRALEESFFRFEVSGNFNNANLGLGYCPYDTDTDSVGDAVDNCPANFEPFQTDSDFDGIGDVCETDNCPAGSVSYWRFDELRGNTAFDLVNNNDGTIIGATFGEGKVSTNVPLFVEEGIGLVFDGIDDYVNLGDIDITGNRLTLEFWVKFNEFPPANSEMHILRKFDGTTEPFFASFSNIDDGKGANRKNIRFGVRTSIRQYILQGEKSLELGKWYHIALTSEGPSIKIYINGQLDSVFDTTSLSLAEFFANFITNNAPVTAGRILSSTSGVFLKGNLDELAIYNEFLSENQIQTHYNSGLNNINYCPYDFDSDTIRDDLDNCPFISNQIQEDMDGDGIGDVCDIFPDAREIDSCEDDPNTGGRWVILNDLSVSGDCLEIKSNNVELVCSGNSIIGTGSGVGVSLSNVNGVSISGCKIENFQIGIKGTTHQSSIIASDFISNTEFGINIMGSNNKIRDNIIQGSNNGINLDGDSNLIELNSIYSNDIGVKLLGSGNRIYFNSLKRNRVGIDSQSLVSGNIITTNFILENKEIGVSSYLRDEIESNLVKDNGISINHRNDGGKIHDNNIFANTLGIQITGNSNNIFSNFIEENELGIKLIDSTQNRIYNNMFDNIENAQDNGNNIWNLAKENKKNIIEGPFTGGNFWHDYTGQDTDGDFIGNTNLPYSSNSKIANGGDNIPLICGDFCKLQRLFIDGPINVVDDILLLGAFFPSDRIDTDLPEPFKSQLVTIYLKNFGKREASNVLVTLSFPDNLGIKVKNNPVSYGNIKQGQSVMGIFEIETQNTPIGKYDYILALSSNDFSKTLTGKFETFSIEKQNEDTFVLRSPIETLTTIEPEIFRDPSFKFENLRELTVRSISVPHTPYQSVHNWNAILQGIEGINIPHIRTNPVDVTSSFKRAMKKFIEFTAKVRKIDKDFLEELEELNNELVRWPEPQGQHEEVQRCLDLQRDILTNILQMEDIKEELSKIEEDMMDLILEDWRDYKEQDSCLNQVSEYEQLIDDFESKLKEFEDKFNELKQKTNELEKLLDDNLNELEKWFGEKEMQKFKDKVKKLEGKNNEIGKQIERAKKTLEREKRNAQVLREACEEEIRKGGGTPSGGAPPQTPRGPVPPPRHSSDAPPQIRKALATALSGLVMIGSLALAPPSAGASLALVTLAAVANNVGAGLNEANPPVVDIFWLGEGETIPLPGESTIAEHVGSTLTFNKPLIFGEEFNSSANFEYRRVTDGSSYTFNIQQDIIFKPFFDMTLSTNKLDYNLGEDIIISVQLSHPQTGMLKGREAFVHAVIVDAKDKLINNRVILRDDGHYPDTKENDGNYIGVYTIKETDSDLSPWTIGVISENTIYDPFPIFGMKDLTVNVRVDTDNDGISDPSDNCPLIPNPDQKDSDSTTNVYESEVSPSEITRVISDPDASNGQAKKAVPSDITDRAKGLVFGPYKKLSPGNYTIIFRLKVSDKTIQNIVARIDASSDFGAVKHAAQELKGIDFNSQSIYQDFTLRFSLDKEVQNGEFVVWYFGHADLYADVVYEKYSDGFGDACDVQTCGNNKKEGTEACDGIDLAGQTCQIKGFDAGTLSCSNTCNFDTSQCFYNQFLRGDSNIDGEVDISDPIKTLLYLYSDSQISCKETADSNDDGKIDISDVLYSLNFLFKAGPTIPQPYPSVGIDPTADSLTCESYNPLAQAGGGGGSVKETIEAIDKSTQDQQTKDSIKNALNIVPKGILSVSSSPTGAYFYLDGKYKGTTSLTPITIKDLYEGPYTVKFTKYNYETYQTTINIQPGQTTTIKQSLKLLASATPSPSLSPSYYIWN